MTLKSALFVAASTAAIISMPTAASAQGVAVPFGDNSSTWANDGECDDPRFEGNGMAATLLDTDLMADANDCRSLHERGQIRLRAAYVDFGDNSSQWANDGECDDPRFRGSGMASVLLESDLLRDANDCRSLYRAGSIDLITARSSFSFGDNSSTWANDGECDDPRFEGPGTAATLLDSDLMRDANDCQTLFNQGRIQLRSAYINWGDDSSTWANDGECDDPRFSGPGAAATLLETDRLRDATDCRMLYEAGRITAN